MSEPPSGLALYLHYPYCARLCPYCDFNVYLRRHRLDDDALLAAYGAQLRALHGRMDAPRALTSVFLGGGTPSLMSPALLDGVLQLAAQQFGLAADVEVTLEANPSEASAARLTNMRAAGVTRLSLGVQSLRDDGLRFYGRTHDVAEARAAAGAAARLFAHWSLDMLYARPKQSVRAWRAELRDALALHAPHYSFYQLTIEPGTAFARQVAAQRWLPPRPELAARLYEATQEACAAVGLAAYEVSNHARAPAQYARHNWHVWQGGEYLGIGPGAAGRVICGGVRHATHAILAPRAWAAACHGPSAGYADWTPLSAAEVRTERALLGLRLAEGVPRRTAEALGLAPLGARGRRLRRAGLVQLDGRGVRVPPKGRLLLDELCAQLLADADDAKAAGD